ncbi:hypothetical protein LCGC14_2826770 [marine sediment metagenome]|uniref:Uncharacterized protein n=1 Tax=marine sediment metagenome TaxID=412755 RepID=A0A0F8Z1Z9_9ZZZZ
MNRYEFTITLGGCGDTVEQAWDDAVDSVYNDKRFSIYDDSIEVKLTEKNIN